MNRTRNISIAVIVIIVAAVGFFGFTSPGHRVLNALGFATADCGGSC
jgi:hypothetical protein